MARVDVPVSPGSGSESTTAGVLAAREVPVSPGFVIWRCPGALGPMFPVRYHIESGALERVQTHLRGAWDTASPLGGMAR